MTRSTVQPDLWHSISTRTDLQGQPGARSGGLRVPTGGLGWEAAFPDGTMDSITEGPEEEVFVPQQQVIL